MTQGMLINIGFGNLVMSSRIVAIAHPESTPVKRLREEAKNRHKLIDVTHGRKTRSVLIADSDHIILSALQPDTLLQRFK